MTLFKRIMAWTLSLVMLVSAFPLQVLAQGPDDADAVVTAEDVNVQGTNSLGMLLSAARAIFPRASYTLLFPAVIVSIITITFYLVGNAFSDACDPRNHV